MGTTTVSPLFAQLQSCPVNINFASGDISSWSARTGLVNGASQNYPAPNSGVSVIPEFNIAATGIRVITSSSSDLYGSFPTVPVINGYAYNYSIQLGSTATSWDLRSGVNNPGGFTRSVTYTINVPAGSVLVPYTMTYAYAMVLENGTHNSNEQPLFKATLSTANGVISCASPEYYLPTNNSAGGGATGATLDTAAAIANGFSLSPVLFLSHAGSNNTAGTLVQDVWTKSWTEVTFDLSPYRGQQVTLTFETHNCAPGAHFAYAYVALKNTCAGLEIAGSRTACANSTFTYSVPTLANATYTWTVPSGWTINSGANTNIINVTAGPAGGKIIVREVNGCADLRDTIDVVSSPPTVAGQVLNNNTVCTGVNSTSLTVNGELGNVLNWISSTDGINWSLIANPAGNYTAQNLTNTTRFRALVQNGSACKIDTSTAAIITVDPKSIGGNLNPVSSDFCIGQDVSSLISLSGNTGSVVNWQVSTDNTNWNNFMPVKSDSTYRVNSLTTTTYYRTIVKSGVCPADTSSFATINFVNVPFPSAAINPPNTEICYGGSTQVNATITIGTGYTWTPAGTLTNQGSGTINTLPYVINAIANPSSTTDYVLRVINAGCPNAFTDTFHVNVRPRIIVFAGNDTAVVANQPLQLNATANVPAANIFNWTPGTGLNFTTIQNPVAILRPESGEKITYIVRATDAFGCFAEDNITVTIFRTGPEIFVPGAFTPNGDGLNDMLTPVYVGIKQLDFFRIYNRWGQEVFSTRQMGKGWDGRIGGVQQSTNNFVFMVRGVDYLGNVILKKGNIVLIK